MAESSTGSIIKYGLLGLAGWWLYSTFFSTSTAPAPASSSGTGAGSPPASASPASSSGGAAAAAQPAAYSGPSLATLYANFLAATKAAVGSDPQVTCPSSTAGQSAALACQGQFTALQAAGGPVALTAPGVLAACLADAVNVAKNAPACDLPQATYDVFNWYLMNRSNAPAALSAPLDPPDHTSVIPITQYWAWVSPLLQKQIVGLSGMGAWGMGHIGAIRQIVRSA